MFVWVYVCTVHVCLYMYVRYMLVCIFVYCIFVSMFVCVSVPACLYMCVLCKTCLQYEYARLFLRQCSWRSGELPNYFDLKNPNSPCPEKREKNNCFKTVISWNFKVNRVWWSPIETCECKLRGYCDELCCPVNARRGNNGSFFTSPTTFNGTTL